MNKSRWRISLCAKRSPSQDSTNGPRFLGVSAESLEGLEVGISDCPARNGSRLEAFQTYWCRLSQHTNPGRPRTRADIRKPVKTMAEANVGWGVLNKHSGEWDFATLADMLA